ncbi:MAG TPA: hypothetical protein VK879_16525 [Candidatus Sulfomarinibacteraceae bacterium]|nr:hypothetical protein [Candidatus Sulfomarinibacteraceae bacterium]
MTSRVSFLVRTLIVAAAGFALLLVGLNQAAAVTEKTPAADSAAQPEAGDGGPVVQATERISIPFGFYATLPMTNSASSVVASGEGACTAGEEITITFTVTQSSSGASVDGVWNGVCTGALQTWTNAPTATPSPNAFVPGPAEACAFAETYDGEDPDPTATQSWCDPVLLGSSHIYLPVSMKP